MDQPKQQDETLFEDITDYGRRKFLKQSGAIVALTVAPPLVSKAAPGEENFPGLVEPVQFTLDINGRARSIMAEPRVTLLDLLRERLDLTGTKKGCDYGQCGACTVHVDGERVLACLSLAVMQQGKKITTIEGLAQDDDLHPMQAAFIEHDGLQCGYCTPGQIMSGIACIKEGHATSREEIKEYMSGNLCRCGAYPNITDAVASVQEKGGRL